MDSTTRANGAAAFRTLAVLAAVAGAVCMPHQGAQAQEAAQCAPHLTGGVSFDDNQHKSWYRRFWTGSCAGVSGWCMSGSPNWNETLGKVSAAAAPQDRASALQKACVVGRLVGREWARDNGVRRIDTGDVQGYGEDLRKAGYSVNSLTAVEQDARAKLVP